MKIVHLVALVGLFISGSAFAGSLPPPVGYTAAQLVFEDTFSTKHLDTAKWNPWMGEDHWKRWGDNGHLPSPYSGENAGSFQVQYNDPYPYAWPTGSQGAHLGGGGPLGLWLVAAPSKKYAALGYEWASSAVTSYGHAYLPAEGGYVQISAKMPDSRYGGWGGLWMMPTSPSNGSEFDLQESGMYATTGDPAANRVLASHWWGAGGSQKKVDTGIDLTAGYHVYGVEYIPGQTWKVYLDGILKFTWTAGSSTNAAYEVILELEMAGPDTRGWHTVADPVNHPGPFTMGVQDVQIYRLP